MLHVRVVSPADLTGPLTSRLGAAPGVYNVVVRAGAARHLLRDKGLKAATSDALIAQCCIDADVPLISRDRDFRHFVRWCGLKLAV